MTAANVNPRSSPTTPQRGNLEMTTDAKQIEDLERRWVAAEIGGDLAVLDELAAEQFALVGPLGFVLDKTQWLDRYRNGDLVTSKLAWHDTQTRLFGTCAVVIGIHKQEAAYRGQPNNGQFRATHIWVHDGGTWRLAGMHLSPITAPPAAPHGTR
jgi:ketosteroid isomerase-like protein